LVASGEGRVEEDFVDGGFPDVGVGLEAVGEDDGDLFGVVRSDGEESDVVVAFVGSEEAFEGIFADVFVVEGGLDGGADVVGERAGATCDAGFADVEGIDDAEANGDGIVRGGGAAEVEDGGSWEVDADAGAEGALFDDLVDVFASEDEGGAVTGVGDEVFAVFDLVVVGGKDAGVEGGCEFAAGLKFVRGRFEGDDPVAAGAFNTEGFGPV
jgi:hypothetical protein